MSAFPTFNLTITSSKMPTFMVALLGILFSRLIFISTENNSTVYVSLPLFKWNLNLNLHTRKIANIYVIIWYIYSLSDELNKGVSNTQHKMLPFHKEINASWKSFFQGILPTFMSLSLVIICNNCTWFIDGNFHHVIVKLNVGKTDI